MKNDKEHLEFIYKRLVHVHLENPNVDYMHRFRKIIDTCVSSQDLNKPLTKREQFAMAAMQGLLANGGWNLLSQERLCSKGRKQCAVTAVNMADELIKQLDGGE